MSNKNEFVASVNRLETLIDLNQTDLKRDVESLIDRRFSSLKEEVNKLKCAQSALDQINNLMALWDDRRNLSDLPNRIRHILEGVTNNQNQTRDLVSSEGGDNVTVENSVNNLGGNEFRTEEHVNSLDTNVPPPSTVNDINSSTSDNEKVNYLSTVEPIPSAVYSSKDVPTSSSIIDTNIKTEDASNSQQSVQMCKRVKMGEDAQYITDSDSDDDCDCDECIYGIVKQEMKEEFDETWQLNPDNGQSVQLWTQVKKEEERSDDENDEVQVAPNDREELNLNRDESLHEESNGTNQCFVNDQQVDKGDHEPNEPVNDGQNQSPITKHSKTRKPSCADKSLVTENSSFENSLASGEVSSPSPMASSKRTRMSSLDRRGNAKQLSSGSRVDLCESDNQNGIDSSGEGEIGVEQIEDDDDETELGEDECAHHKIEIVKLKCREEDCEDEVADRVELHDHLRVKHHKSPFCCLAEGCGERFEQWNGHGLGNHVKDNHSNISTWQCPHCTKTFKSQHRLYYHLYFYHFEGQFKCGFDGCHYDRVATFRIEIKNHQLSVHPMSTIYTCDLSNAPGTCVTILQHNIAL